MSVNALSIPSEMKTLVYVSFLDNFLVFKSFLDVRQLLLFLLLIVTFVRNPLALRTYSWDWTLGRHQYFLAGTILAGTADPSGHEGGAGMAQ